MLGTSATRANHQGRSPMASYPILGVGKFDHLCHYFPGFCEVVDALRGDPDGCKPYPQEPRRNVVTDPTAPVRLWRQLLASFGFVLTQPGFARFAQWVTGTVLAD